MEVFCATGRRRQLRIGYGPRPSDLPRGAIIRWRKASGAEGSRTLDLLNAMRTHGRRDRARRCISVQETEGSTPAPQPVEHGCEPCDRPRTVPCLSALPRRVVVRRLAPVSAPRRSSAAAIRSLQNGPCASPGGRGYSNTQTTMRTIMGAQSAITLTTRSSDADAVRRIGGGARRGVGAPMGTVLEFRKHM